MTSVEKQIVDKVLRDMPKATTRGLARYLLLKFPEVFTSFNNAREWVRRHRDETRAKPKGAEANKRTKKEREMSMKWGAIIPDPDKVSCEPVKMDDAVSRWLVVSDLHVPYHDKKALEICLEREAGEVDGVLINGDGPDCYQISNFMRDPRLRKFKDEIHMWCDVLDVFRSMPGIKRVMWKLGNHEYRLERYLMQRAPELFETDIVSYSTLCDLDKRGVELVPANAHIVHHELTILHGHEWSSRSSSSVNQARGNFLQALDCTLSGHGHRSSHHHEPTLRGRPISCWSVGCLCDLHPEYRQLNKWNHGYAVLKTGSAWEVENKRIIDGRVL